MPSALPLGASAQLHPVYEKSALELNCTPYVIVIEAALATGR